MKMASEHHVVAHVLTRLLKAGAEENTLYTCQSQVAAGHKVILVHGREFDPEVRARARFICDVVEVSSLVHPISLREDLRALRDLTRLFRAYAVDVVHTHQSKAGILGRMAAKLARVHLIIHGVHILPWVMVSRWHATIYLAAERFCASFTDVFVDVSPSVRDTCLESSIGDAAQHFVAFSAMDVAKSYLAWSRARAALPWR
jgi:hypothetical protein